MSSAQTVFVVDDSPRMRKSVSAFLVAARLHVETFASGEGFLAAYHPSRAGCLILDIRMPEMSGLELQEILQARGSTLPIIVVSGEAGLQDVVRTMKLGSFEFIEKPYPPEFLLKRVREALKQDLRVRRENAHLSELRERYRDLTSRERQILSWVIAGNQSKAIAGKIGLAVSTVDNHRANLLKKLKAETSADLTRIALLVDPSLAFPRIED